MLTNDLELTRFYDIHALMLLTGLLWVLCHVNQYNISGYDIRCRSTFRPDPELAIFRYIPTHILLQHIWTVQSHVESDVQERLVLYVDAYKSA